MPISYRQSGVDIDAGDAFVEAIKPLAQSTHRPGVVGSLGGFAGLFHLEPGKYRDPLLVSSTDGVGTKLKLAFAANLHHTVGIDLVAMSVNDLVVTGAEPLFFLDYFATGKLDVAQGRAIVSGVAEGCRQAGCALLGGETAEMPGLYARGEYDLAGFAVGVVERDELLGPERVREGDVLVGIASSGLHSNGFSLVRRVFLERGQPDQALLEELLTPTTIYVRYALALKAQGQLHALAHITGSGLPGNLPRVVPETLAVELRRGSWPEPPIFQRLRREGPVDDADMLHTFNLGLGLVAILPATAAPAAQALAAEHGFGSWQVGRIVRRDGGPDFRLLDG
ncbi:MAG TPA: phosphoribosylformylglycinamidine cyclo-ligase [Myxococcota bacterium]|nr:phosphoribosylformylglycinamidine cyclo-ligase [Myxococcota bacterium]HRY92537.1 phosphoribosylformylglycinamidine cyclo-ligase [Myxococcota bacterium]HSA22057.1 phosphoribosylformylglycinamidine cyclo-ligase [Myxococcota bacterium]